MTHKSRHHRHAIKFKVAQEASKGLKTTTELSQEYNIHPNRISAWKKQLKEEGPRLYVTEIKQIMRRTFANVGRNDLCPCGSGKKYKHCHGRSVPKCSLKSLPRPQSRSQVLQLQIQSR
jgi:uncharacterized protein YchJ